MSKLQETDRQVFVGHLRSNKRFAATSINHAVSALRNFSRYALEKRLHKRDLAMVQMLMQCGLRIGEMQRLSVNDVVLHRTSGHIRVRAEKTGADRIVPLNASVRHALHNYLAIRGEISIQYLIKKYLCLIGRPELSARDLRRHLAHELYAKTHNPPVVQQVLGHRNLATTARYVQATEEEIQAALEQLSENIYHNKPQDIGDEPPN
jgi:integrase